MVSHIGTSIAEASYNFCDFPVGGSLPPIPTPHPSGSLQDFSGKEKVEMQSAEKLPLFYGKQVKGSPDAG